MKESYVEPEMEVIVFDLGDSILTDVILTSNKLPEVEIEEP